MNWGTKWDVYFDRITPKDMGWAEGCTSFEFSFETADAPPANWFFQIIKKYPDLSLMMHYHEWEAFAAGDIYGDKGHCLVDEYDKVRCRELFKDFLDELGKGEQNDDLALSGS